MFCESSRRHLISLFLILSSLLFSSCSTSDRGCKAGDNFDNNSTEFDSEVPLGSDDYRDKNNIIMDQRESLIKWQSTGLITNGLEDVVIDIVGRWTPWGQNTMKVEKTVIGEDGKAKVTIEFIEKICSGFPLQDVVAATEVISDVRYITLTNPDPRSGGYPCWLNNGIGLYLLFRDPGSVDPNSNASTVKNPISGTIHLNDENNEGSSRFIISRNGDNVKDSNGMPVRLKKGMEIYGKINDAYYPDNYGTYELNFVSGVYKAKRSPIFQNCRDFIVKPVQDVAKKIFLAIVSDTAYRRGIYALLTLYIVVTALMYLMGAIQMQLGELTIRIFKIGLVLVILTPNAWNFFYNHLFRLYIDGIDQMINIIVSGADGYDPDNPVGFMDRITEKIMSPVIMNRIVAIMNANMAIGTLYVSIFAMILMFFSICVIFSFASYIIGLIILSIVTAMFPIFLAMILFNFTKQIFQEYLDAVLGYTFQVIITFVILFFMANIIQYEIQRALGFKICVAPTVNFNPFNNIGNDVLDKYYDKQDKTTGVWEGTDSSPLVTKAWVPGESGLYKTIPAFSLFIPIYNLYSLYDMFVGKHYAFKYNIEKVFVPPKYDKVRFRYTALPFLDPDTNFNPNNLPPGYINCMAFPNKSNCDPDKVFPGGIGQPDHERIKDIMFKDHSWYFVDFGDLFVIILFMFVLWELNINFGPNIAKWIALSGKGYSMPQAVLGASIISAYNNYTSALQKFSQNGTTLGKYLGGGLMMLTTTQGFIFQQLSIKSIGKLSDSILDNGGKLVKRALGMASGISPIMDSFPSMPDNRFTRFASQLGGAIMDSVVYQSLDSRTISSQAKDMDDEKSNMRGIHHLQDVVGGYIDFQVGKFDKFGASALYHGLNPLDNNAGRLFGSYDTHFSFKDGFSKTEESGFIGRLANAVAGDAINKFFYDKTGDDKNLFFSHEESVSSAFGGLFTADASKIGGYGSGKLDFDTYWEAIHREYNNSKDEIDTRSKEDKDKVEENTISTSKVGDSGATDPKTIITELPEPVFEPVIPEEAPKLYSVPPIDKFDSDVEGPILTTDTVNIEGPPSTPYNVGSAPDTRFLDEPPVLDQQPFSTSTNKSSDTLNDKDYSDGLNPFADNSSNSLLNNNSDTQSYQEQMHEKHDKTNIDYSNELNPFADNSSNPFLNDNNDMQSYQEQMHDDSISEVGVLSSNVSTTRIDDSSSITTSSSDYSNSTITEQSSDSDIARLSDFDDENIPINSGTNSFSNSSGEMHSNQVYQKDTPNFNDEGADNVGVTPDLNKNDYADNDTQDNIPITTKEFKSDDVQDIRANATDNVLEENRSISEEESYSTPKDTTDTNEDTKQAEIYQENNESLVDKPTIINEGNNGSKDTIESKNENQISTESSDYIVQDPGNTNIEDISYTSSTNEHEVIIDNQVSNSDLNQSNTDEIITSSLFNQESYIDNQDDLSNSQITANQDDQENIVVSDKKIETIEANDDQYGINNNQYVESKDNGESRTQEIIDALESKNDSNKSQGPDSHDSGRAVETEFNVTQSYQSEQSGSSSSSTNSNSNSDMSSSSSMQDSNNNSSQFKYVDLSKNTGSGQNSNSQDQGVSNDLELKETEIKKDSSLKEKVVGNIDDEVRPMRLNEQIEAVDKELRELYNEPDADINPRIQELEAKLKELMDKKGL